MGKDEGVDAVADRAGHHRDVQRALRGLLAARRAAKSKLYRVAAILASFLVHLAILYITPLYKVFSVALIMLSVICYELIELIQQAVLFVMILKLVAGWMRNPCDKRTSVQRFA